MPNPIPEYIVDTGIVGAGAPTYAVYVRRPSGSLRRIASIELPVCDTRLEALDYLEFWLHCKAVSGPRCDRAEYRRQLARVQGELVAAGGKADPGCTGWPYGSPEWTRAKAALEGVASGQG